MVKRTSRKKASHTKFLIGAGDIIDRFISVHIKISILESIVKNQDKTDAEAGHAARLIRKLNVERIALRNVLNRRFGGGFEDLKVEYFDVLEKVFKKTKKQVNL